MSNHTPGPWCFDDDTVWSECSQDEIAIVVRIYEQDKEFEANANLIAASPELLEALEYLSTRLESIEDIRIAHEVIAKAKGETE